jgi:galactokinase
MNLKALKAEFIKRFGDGGELRVFASPGRVNLIGEHVDYNGGFVFPAALKLATTIIARKRNDNMIRMAATDLDVTVLADISRLEDYKDLSWGNYQLGVAHELQRDGADIIGCDLLYDDTVPHGGGLSSSAAIEVATALCLKTFSNEAQGIKDEVDMKYMAVIGQRAENNYIGVACGIMDQFASAMGRENHAIFLDCKDLSYSLVPLNLAGKSLIIANTNKKRSLIVSKYNERRAECEEAMRSLKTVFPDKNYLGEISSEDFERECLKITDEIVRKRAKHVVYECERVLKSVEALNKNDIMTFGALINQSHDSLRDLYEVTGDELDTLVSAARQVKGCVGARMTGAGFGGCTVNIVDNSAIDEFISRVNAEYTEKIGYAPTFYVTEIGDGGRELK